MKNKIPVPNSTAPTDVDVSINHKYNAIKVEGCNIILSKLLGEVLTIIDASTDGDKNKAIKDLVREKFSKKQDAIWDLSVATQEKEGCGHAPKFNWEDWLIPYVDSDKYGFEYKDIRI
jgi:hypothetical protein